MANVGASTGRWVSQSMTERDFAPFKAFILRLFKIPIVYSVGLSTALKETMQLSRASDQRWREGVKE